MKIGIASDHRGYDLKEYLFKYLNNNGYETIDFGTNSSNENVDYTKYAFIVGNAVASKQIDYGIVICGTGIGISIACNKVKGIRCAKVDNKKEAVLTRRDNNANVLALSGTMLKVKAKTIVNAFLATDFSYIDRYVNRINQITTYEESNKIE